VTAYQQVRILRATAAAGPVACDLGRVPHHGEMLKSPLQVKAAAKLLVCNALQRRCPCRNSE
jgi:hypothetical protein